VKQRELELLASRNFLRPSLDAVSQYRWRGFGQDLSGTNSAVSSFGDGQFQEWQLGLEYQLPVGLRRGHAGVRNAQLSLARDSELLREMERAVHMGLGNAINEAARAFENLELQDKRLSSIVKQLNAITAATDEGEKAELDVRLETHRRLLDARLKYYQAEVEYMLALKNVNLERGSLLNYSNVQLAEEASGVAVNSDGIVRAEVASAILNGRDPAAGYAK
jgi:hypothetical protein